MKKLCVLLMVLAAGVCASAGVALPDWSGYERTVHAEWSSWNSVEEGVYTPDAWNASDASALALTDAPDAVAWEAFSYAGGHDGRDGVLLLEGLGYWTMDFFMPNYAGGETKEISVQVTYQSLGYAPILGVDACLGDELLVNGVSGPYSLGQDVLEGNWVTEAFLFVVTPSSDYEFITLGFPTSDGQAIGVDRVVIDSVMVPEPASMGLMALGALLFVKKRK